MFYFGVEHEVAFINNRGEFADFSCTKFDDFNQIIQKLPIYMDDYSQLRIGDAGIKQKRWYIEGFERFADSEKVIDCIPKGIEIRTTIHSTIQGVIAELSNSFELLRHVAAEWGFSPVLISFNAYQKIYEPTPPLNQYELQRIEASPEEQTAKIPMVTYGPDLNISIPGLTSEQVIDLGKKLTFYSPYIIPFSFSSPFYQSKLWSGLSIRTYIRTGARQAATVFLEKPEDLIESNPILTKIARIPSEVGRIEFKAFDSCDDFSLYGALLALIKGIILDNSLPGCATVPDRDLHQISGRYGFENKEIFLMANHVLEAAETALKDDLDLHLLERLKDLLAPGKTKADRLINDFKEFGTIQEALRQTYQDK